MLVFSELDDLSQLNEDLTQERLNQIEKDKYENKLETYRKMAD